MNILDFFDVNNIDHLEAFQEFMITGVWSKGFISEKIVFDPSWQSVIMTRILDKYFDRILSICRGDMFNFAVKELVEGRSWKVIQNTMRTAITISPNIPVEIKGLITGINPTDNTADGDGSGIIGELFRFMNQMIGKLELAHRRSKQGDVSL